MMAWLKSRNPLWVGVIGAAVIAVLVAGSVAFGELGIGDARHEAEFAHSGGIRAGDEVRVAGMGVGEVTSTRLDGDKVLVSFRTRRGVHLGTATRASIKLATLLGGRYLELSPLGEGDLSDRITLARTSVPFDLQNVVQTGTPAVEQIDAVKLRESLQVLTDTFRGTPEVGRKALDGLSQVSEVVSKRQGQISQLISSADGITKLLNENRTQVFALMGQADVLLKKLVARKQLITNILTDFQQLTTQLQGLLNDNRPQLQPLLANLGGVTDILERNNAAVGEALKLLAPAARYLTNSVGDGDYLTINLPYAIFPDNLLCLTGAVKGCK
ncbi:MCE family protein [Amycolatopsis sp. cg5]|uniref:MCE family protein n=1 Tax=Amycolatopsis sp. cg5 TaxID=3238802 RepID=UPI0035246321